MTVDNHLDLSWNALSSSGMRIKYLSDLKSIMWGLIIDGGAGNRQTEHHAADIHQPNSFSYTPLEISGLKTLRLHAVYIHIDSHTWCNCFKGRGLKWSRAKGDVNNHPHLIKLSANDSFLINLSTWSTCHYHIYSDPQLMTVFRTMHTIFQTNISDLK